MNPNDWPDEDEVREMERTHTFVADPVTGDVMHAQPDEPTEVVVAGATMPATPSVLRQMRDHLTNVVLQARAERGEVHTAEDVFPVVNRLADVIDGLDDYAHAFKTVRAEAVGFIGDELELAVGEQDGIPTSGLKVPAPDGTTVDVALDVTSGKYSFDLDALIKVVVADQIGWLDDPDHGDDPAWSTPEAAMERAIHAALALGSFTPQVTKVQAFKEEVARTDPKMASTIQWTKADNTFKGVKVKREQPKQRRTR